jgi:hypothetical protein
MKVFMKTKSEMHSVWFIFESNIGVVVSHSGGVR